MRRFRVKNLEKFQHYKDRRPPWIKLHAELLEDYEFACLHDASKLHLILIWVLASRHNNSLPWDTAWIAKRIGATDDIDLDALEGAGFIIEIQDCKKAEQNASAAIAERKQNAPQRTENRERDSVPNGTGAEAPKAIDPAKPCYEFGKPLLAKYGHSANKAGGLITKWLKAHSPESLLSTLQHAASAERHDIVAFVEGCLKDPLAIPEFLKRGQNGETKQARAERSAERIARVTARLQ